MFDVNLYGLIDMYVAGLVDLEISPTEAAEYYLATRRAAFAALYEADATEEDYKVFLDLTGY